MYGDPPIGVKIIKKAEPKEEKPAFGQKVNVCKQTVTEAVEAAAAVVEDNPFIASFSLSKST